MPKKVWLWIIIPLFAMMIVAYLFYQEISYKSGELIVIKPYVPNEHMVYEVAHYGVANASYKGRDVAIDIDSYGGGQIQGEKDSYYYLVKDDYKVRRIRTPLSSLKKGDVIEITYRGSMRE